MNRTKHHRNFRKLLFVSIITILTSGIFYKYLTSTECSATNSSVTTTNTTITHLMEGTKIEYIPASGGEMIRHKYYILSFNDRYKQANWVYYSLKLRATKTATERTNNFRADKMITSGSAKPSDYTKSGYDRGHLCPAGDMTQSSEAMSETFYMSNISPQLPAFNRGIWKSLEEQVRKWGMREQLYIVTGPVFKKLKGTIGKNKITVPGFYYKIIYSPAHQQMIGFLLPNEKSQQPLSDYVVSVDSVENLTKIDFFPQLPDPIENDLEAYSYYEKWK
ncbi:MAG: DNA/RNA non-specific endonuclease [Odoribacter sp.]